MVREVPSGRNNSIDTKFSKVVHSLDERAGAQGVRARAANVGNELPELNLVQSCIRAILSCINSNK